MSTPLRYDGMERLAELPVDARPQTKRINSNINVERYDSLQRIFREYGLKISEGMRLGLNILAGILPALSRGGELVIREPGGVERAYVFPFLLDSDLGADRTSFEPIRPAEYHSCFISYSHADQQFVRRLHEKLQLSGINCWIDSHSMRPGDVIEDEIREAILRSDRVLLICSKDSLGSWWVDSEISIVLDKERRLLKESRQKISVLIPIDLDGHMFSDEWESAKREQINKRVAADFVGWRRSDAVFGAQFEELLKALKVRPVLT